MIRVRIADDHQLVRQGLVRILHDEPDIIVVGEATDVPRPWPWSRQTSLTSS